MFFYPSNYDGKVGLINTVQYTRFSCIYEKCLKDCRLLYLTLVIDHFTGELFKALYQVFFIIYFIP